MLFFAIPAGSQRKLWINLTYLMRYVILPKEEFDALEPDLGSVPHQFVSRFEEAYGAHFVSYNMHCVTHIGKIRLFGESANHYSTFPFESMYSQLISAICAGTSNTPKQGLTAFYAKYNQTHVCEDWKKLRFNKDTAKTTDKYIYTFDGKYQFLKVKEVKDELLVCNKIITSPFRDFHRFDLVGIYYLCDVLPELVNVNLREVKGKAVICKEFIISIPLNVLLY